MRARSVGVCVPTCVHVHVPTTEMCSWCCQAGRRWPRSLGVCRDSSRRAGSAVAVCAVAQRQRAGEASVVAHGALWHERRRLARNRLQAAAKGPGEPVQLRCVHQPIYLHCYT